MQMRNLGRTGIEVSAVCLGTMTFGDQTGEADAFAQMDMALARGVNCFDTAEIYSVPPKPETYGETERIIGRWLKRSGKRARIVIATKVMGRTGEWVWPRPEHMREQGQSRLSEGPRSRVFDQAENRLHAQKALLAMLMG